MITLHADELGKDFLVDLTFIRVPLEGGLAGGVKVEFAWYAAPRLRGSGREAAEPAQ